MANTLFDKIWDKHVVQLVEDGPTQLYIDRLYCHASKLTLLQRMQKSLDLRILEC